MTRAKEMRDLPLAIDVDSSGNVGIGTSSPADQLELFAGSERLMIGANSPSTYSRVAARNTGNSGYRGLKIDGSDLLLNTESGSGNIIMSTGGGNVGIGTNNPGANLDIQDSNGATLFMDDTNGRSLNLRTANNSTQNSNISSYAGLYLGGSDNANHVVIESGGDVGIGTNNPFYRLQIDQGTTATYATSFRNTADNLQLVVGTTTGGLINIQGKTINSGTAYQIALQSEGGNVGIGTTSPGRTLEVHSGGATSFIRVRYNSGYYTDYNTNGINFAGTNQSFTFSDNGAAKVKIASGGNVGIGTTSPDSKLEIEGNVSSTTLFSGFGGLRIQNANGAAHGVTAEMNFTAGTGSSNRGAAIGSQFTSAASGNDLYFATNASSVTSTNTLTERLRITSAGKVGIGTASPLRNFSVIGSDTSSSGYKDIAEFLEPNTTGGTVSVNFGVANSLNNLGKVDFTYVGAGSTDNWVSIGFHSNDNKLKVYANGLVEVASYLKSKKGTIQTVVNQPTIYTSANPVNTWAEVNSNFRIDITPRFASGTMILGTYSIPMNPTGASNILMAIQPWYSTNGGTTKNIISQGITSGSRHNLAVSWFRSSNGFDGNDMQNHVVKFYLDGITASTTVVFGWYFRSEGSNTTYFCHSNGNNSLWGWTAPMYLELREIIA